MVNDGRRGEHLVIENVSHYYMSKGRRVEALRDVSLSVPPGSVTCVVGPSGCGKSTLLSMAAGLLAPSEGQITWNGAPIRPGRNQEMAMVFQSPGLFPWMTVERNVEVGLRTRGTGRHEAAKTVAEILHAVGLSEFRKAYPAQLSGGMAQRVGIARALALRPRLLLLDEPFAAVDAFTRIKLQRELLSLLDLGRPTAVFVTHDVSEAVYLGDTVVVMTPRPGRIKTTLRIDPEDRDRTSAGYAQKTAQILENLGVTGDMVEKGMA